MAHIEDLWLAKDGTPKARNGQGMRWVVKYDGPDGRRHKRSFTHKVKAEAYLAEVAVQVSAGDWTDPALGKITVAALAERWLPTQATKRDRYYRSQKSKLECHVLPYFGERRINTITTPEVEAWLADLLGGHLSPDSVRSVHGVFKRLMDYAVRGERIRRNRVAEAANVPKKAQGIHHTYLTHDQVADLAGAALRPRERPAGPGGHWGAPVPLSPAQQAAREAFAAMLVTDCYTGLRFGELVGLDVAKYDRRRQRLLVDRQYNGEELKDHARRTAPLPAIVAETLEGVIGNRVSGPMFPSPRGARWAYKRFRIWFDAAAEQAGMPGLKPHDMRHTAASLAVQAGANVKAVQEMLGHESATLTLDTYSALFDGDLDDVAARMNKAMNKAMKKAAKKAGKGGVERAA